METKGNPASGTFEVKIMTNRLIRKPELTRMTGLSPSTLWRLEKSGEFPARRQIGPNSVAWFEKDIRDWIDSRPAYVSATYEKNAPEEKGGNHANK